MDLTSTLNLTPYLSYAVEGTLYVAVVLFIIFSLVLLYHVERYSLEKARAIGFFGAYLVGGALIIISMTTAFFAL